MDLPVPPNVHAMVVIFTTVIALLLFTRKKIPLETSSFIILIGLAVGFEIFPFRSEGKALNAVDFFHGFGHDLKG